MKIHQEPGERYCEPSMMTAPERFNEVKKTVLHLCVQGTFIPDCYERGTIDMRWQSMEELQASISRFLEGVAGGVVED